MQVYLLLVVHFYNTDFEIALPLLIEYCLIGGSQVFIRPL